MSDESEIRHRCTPVGVCVRRLSVGVRRWRGSRRVELSRSEWIAVAMIRERARRVIGVIEVEVGSGKWEISLSRERRRRTGSEG